ncbi:hypothetical protein WJX81_007597 [Elliptochloris bilobata]|uniref:Glyoxal or galactose oxidase n=1 Tax=Elliptochloris bilobata TaxID=381761 RepID=A0AAW1RN17_9CHLO
MHLNGCVLLVLSALFSDFLLLSVAAVNALGPQDAPSLPDILASSRAPAPAISTHPNPDWGKHNRARGGLGSNQAVEAAGPGLCPDPLDQLYDTCPIPDLPRIPYKPGGGPTGANPPLLLPPTLTPAALQTAVSNGQVVEEKNQTAYAKAAKGQVKQGQQVQDVSQLTWVEFAMTEQTVISINSGDSWAIRNTDCGLAPIHGIMTKYNKFIMIDRTFYGTEVPNPEGVKASEYDVATDTYRNLTSGIQSNSWCSAGGMLPGGLVVDLGGGGDQPNPAPNGGGNNIRLIQSCSDGSCQFNEAQSNATQRLLTYRWYPSAIQTGDGRLLIASGQDLDEGTGQHGGSYEFWPRMGVNESSQANMNLPVDFDSPPAVCGPNNACQARPLYPHIHLLPTGEYFYSAINQWFVAYLYAGASPADSHGKLTKGPGFLDPRYGDGGTPITYPGSGTSFMLPLRPPYTSVTVVACGGSWANFNTNAFVDPDCAVITPTDPAPVSSRTTGTTMINKRVMPYCITLLDGNVACMMGAGSGGSGYYSAINPVLQVDLLNTTTMRFSAGATATVPRMYHSVASLVASGAVITAGSNPQGSYLFQSDPPNGVFPSELRVEYYYPWYFSVPRPLLQSVTGSGSSFKAGSSIIVSAQLTSLTNTQTVAVINPGFSTHNLQMSQRYVQLASTCTTPVARSGCDASYIAFVQCICTIPANTFVTPPGDYLVTLLDGLVPSQAQWISIGKQGPGKQDQGFFILAVLPALLNLAPLSSAQTGSALLHLSQGAEALGPQDAPSLPRGAVSAPAPGLTTLPNPEWGGHNRTRGPAATEASGPGLCPNYLDQIYNTCPVPNLPRIPYKPGGGPVDNDPALLLPPKLTARAVQQAINMGLVVKEMNESDAHSGTTGSVQQVTQGDLGQLTKAENAVFEQTVIAINSGDSWAIRNTDCGLAPIHGVLNKYNKFIMIDRTFYGTMAPNPEGVKASEYDVITNTYRNLTSGIQSNSWCSAGGVLPGSLVVDLGGGGDQGYNVVNGGGQNIRLLQSCNTGTCQIYEAQSNASQRLLTYRWYPSAIQTPDGRLLVASGQDLDEGTGQHGGSYEFWPRKGVNESDQGNMNLPVNFDFPPAVCGPNNACQPRPLYPYIHLLPTGEYFYCAINQWFVAYLYAGASPADSHGKLTKGPGFLDPRYGDGGTPITYPGSGTSFMLPLRPPYSSVTVVMCGGSWANFNTDAYVDPDCAVITPTDPNPVSSRTTGTTMINKRVMPYCINLLDSNVACMMGAGSGGSGYYAAINPVLTVDLLNTTTMRFSAGATATVPRMYHSIASLVASGAVITAGSNPQGSYMNQYDPANGVFPSELRVEYYYPWYFSVPRPLLQSVVATAGGSPKSYAAGSQITVGAQLTALTNKQTVAVINPGFSTHNVQMSQRYVQLSCSCGTPVARSGCDATYIATVSCVCTVPASANVTPPGDYLITLLDGKVPSQAQWISIG